MWRKVLTLLFAVCCIFLYLCVVIIESYNKRLKNKVMKKFKLHELVNIFENEHGTAVLWALVEPYKKQLYVYFSRFYCIEPILMVTSVTNNSSYCRIVPESDFFDAVCAYMGECPDLEDGESESYAEYESICAYSQTLKNML